MIHALREDVFSLSHYHEMLDLKYSGAVPEKSIYLLKTRALRMTTFLIVDERYLIWEIDEVLHDQQQSFVSSRMHGAFIIEDPRKEIIQYFESVLRDIEYSASVLKEELPDLKIG